MVRGCLFSLFHTSLNGLSWSLVIHTFTGMHSHAKEHLSCLRLPETTSLVCTGQHVFAHSLRAFMLSGVPKCLGCSTSSSICSHTADHCGCTAGKESFQRLWLISAVALMGNAHRIATDPNNARLALSPTVAVAICLQQGQKLEVVPQGGKHACKVICARFSYHVLTRPCPDSINRQTVTEPLLGQLCSMCEWLHALCIPYPQLHGKGTPLLRYFSISC